MEQPEPRVTDSEVLGFLSLLLGISLALLLQFVGRIAVSWQRIKRPWPILIWVTTSVLCHANYWSSMALFLPDRLPSLHFYTILAFPCCLVICTTILCNIDLGDNSGEGGIVNLYEHYKRIAPSYYSTVVVMLFFAQFEDLYLPDEVGFLSLLPYRVAGCVLCISLWLTRNRYHWSVFGASCGLFLHIAFSMVDP